MQIIAEEIEFAESKNTGSAQSAPQSYSNSSSEGSRPAADGFMNIPDSIDSEELPFNF